MYQELNSSRSVAILTNNEASARMSDLLAQQARVVERISKLQESQRLIAGDSTYSELFAQNSSRIEVLKTQLQLIIRELTGLVTFSTISFLNLGVNLQSKQVNGIIGPDQEEISIIEKLPEASLPKHRSGIDTIQLGVTALGVLGLGTQTEVAYVQTEQGGTEVAALPPTSIDGARISFVYTEVTDPDLISRLQSFFVLPEVENLQFLEQTVPGFDFGKKVFRVIGPGSEFWVGQSTENGTPVFTLLANESPLQSIMDFYQLYSNVEIKGQTRVRTGASVSEPLIAELQAGTFKVKDVVSSDGYTWIAIEYSDGRIGYVADIGGNLQFRTNLDEFKTVTLTEAGQTIREIVEIYNKPQIDGDVYQAYYSQKYVQEISKTSNFNVDPTTVQNADRVMQQMILNGANSRIKIKIQWGDEVTLKPYVDVRRAVPDTRDSEEIVGSLRKITHIIVTAQEMSTLLEVFRTSASLPEHVQFKMIYGSNQFFDAGFGYFDTDGVFVLITRETFKPEQVAKLTNGAALIADGPATATVLVQDAIAFAGSGRRADLDSIDRIYDAFGCTQSANYCQGSFPPSFSFQ